MEIFISWSGNRSRRLAEAFRDWMPRVIQAVEPWMSPDIEKGLRWNSELTGRLESSQVGLICLTPESLNAPWILFEAGALSRPSRAHVCTILLGLAPSDVEMPLAQFDHTALDQKEEILKLVRTINGVVKDAKERAPDEAVLIDTFEKYYPDLDKAICGIASLPSAAPSRGRTERQLLEELLEISRDLHRETVGRRAQQIVDGPSSGLGNKSRRIALEQLLAALDPSIARRAALMLDPSSDADMRYRAWLERKALELKGENDPPEVPPHDATETPDAPAE